MKPGTIAMYLLSLKLITFGLATPSVSAMDAPASEAIETVQTCAEVDPATETEVWTRPVPDGLDRFAYPAWFKRLGADKYDEGYALAKTWDCGVIMAGNTNSDTNGKTKAWLVKLNLDGYVQWEQTYGTAPVHQVRDVLALPDGGFIMAGYAGSGPAQTHDLWLARGDAAGNLTWERTHGGSDRDHATALAMTAEGDFLVAGATASKGNGSSDAWLIKIDKAGDLMWEKTYGGAAFETAATIALLPDGSALFAGLQTSDSKDGTDAWVVKIAADGEILWEKRYGGAGTQRATHLLTQPDGSFLMLGASDVPRVMRSGAWLLRADPDGNEIWGRTYGQEYTVLKRMLALPGGDTLLAGTASKPGQRKFQGWLLRIGEDGTEISDHYVGTDAVSENGRSIVLLPGGEILFQGVTSLRHGNTAGNTDSWLTRLKFYPE